MARITPLILIDMDCTLVDLVPAWIKVIKDKYGYLPATKSTYKVWKWYPDLSKEDVMGVLGEPDFFRNLPPMDNSIAVIKNWEVEGIDVRFATVISPSSPDIFKQKYDWIGKHLPGMEDRLIGFSARGSKALIRGQCLIDDDVDNLVDMIGRGMPILYSQPWNGGQYNEFTRGNGWAQVDILVRGHLKNIGLIN